MRWIDLCIRTGIRCHPAPLNRIPRSRPSLSAASDRGCRRRAIRASCSMRRSDRRPSRCRSQQPPSHFQPSTKRPCSPQRFVQSPAQIDHRLAPRDDLPRGRIGRLRGAFASTIPAPLPLVNADAASGVDVGCVSKLVMTEDSRSEKNADRTFVVEACFNCEPLQHAAQFIRQFARHHRVRRRRRDAVSAARRYGDEPASQVMITVAPHRRMSRCTRSGPAAVRQLFRSWSVCRCSRRAQ